MAKKNIQSAIYNIQSKAFTIVELLVAMSLLVILLGLSGIVFHTTVAAHRAAGATIDVSRNLRAVTEQLNTDFQGLRKDAPLFIAFNAFDSDGDLFPDTYLDTIHFFADGDFQTGKQYTYWRDSNNDGILDIDDRKKTIHANTARVYYGHANSVDLISNPGATSDFDVYQVLTRKSHLLTADSSIIMEFFEIPAITNMGSGLVDYTPFDTSFGLNLDENQLEFNTITLTNWINALNFLNAGNPDNTDAFIMNCMTDSSRPMIDFEDINTLHLLLSQGVAQMKIQWAYTTDDLNIAAPVFAGIRWWPEVDPAGDGSITSDFANMGNPFGVYLMMLVGPSLDVDNNGIDDWFANQLCRTDTDGIARNGNEVYFKSRFYPKALKFTFVLKDSNGIFADGKAFTHIVYLDN